LIITQITDIHTIQQNLTKEHHSRDSSSSEEMTRRLMSLLNVVCYAIKSTILTTILT